MAQPTVGDWRDPVGSVRSLGNLQPKCATVCANMSRIDEPQSDLTRKQRREQARSERKTLEEAERSSTESRRRFTQILGALIVIAVIGIIVALVASSGSKKSASSGSNTSSAGVEADLMATPAPWPPQYAGLLQRIAGAHLPPYGTSYHVHAVMQIYVNGKQVPIASQIGIDAQEEFLAPLHTHDSSGIIHMEATEPYPFKLSQFIAVWGIKFTNTQLGAYKDENGKELALYANGTRVPSPVGYVMKPHDKLVLEYGNPKSFVKDFSFNWPLGL